MNPEQHDKLNALAACVQADSLEPATPALLSVRVSRPSRCATAVTRRPALIEAGPEFLEFPKLTRQDHLYAWEWEKTLALAKQCLSMSRAEATRMKR